jgi:AraC-like DNA-binding protein
MLRLLAQGMRDLGLDPEAALPRAGQQHATVSLHDKRALVGAALAQGGFGCLALLGRGLHHFAHEPTYHALVSAGDVLDLFARWARLERYIHSNHRVEVHRITSQCAHLTHQSLSGKAPPLPAEDLVVLGVLVALLEAMGASGVTAQVAGVAAYPRPNHKAMQQVAQRGLTARWVIRWRTLTAPQPAAPVTAVPKDWPRLAQRAFAALSANLMQPPSVSGLAQSLSLSSRSLQRQLALAGLSYTHVLAQARCAAAAQWLTHSTLPIAEVGYLSGYADQPHFTRNFYERVGLTPQRYRQAFAVPRAVSRSSPHR